MKTCSANKCSYPVFSHGYCKSHQYMRKDEKYDKRTPIQKYYDNLKKNGCVNKDGGLIVSKTEELIEKTELQKWFTKKMKTSKKVCENCGASLEHYNETDWHGSQHHLFDKALYHSVRIHPINHCILGMWCCHSQWHTNWENAMKMPIFQKVLPRMITVYNDIAFEEKRKIPDFLIPILDPDPFDSN